MADLHEELYDKPEKILVKSGELHIEGWLLGAVHKINPFRLVYYIVQSFESGEEGLVNPEDITHLD
jgi:hypothetical protein